MADLTITASNVVAGSNAVIETKLTSGAITAGEVVYLDANDKYNLADTDSATPAVRKPRGIALNSAASGQYMTIIKEGDVTLGSVLTKGSIYVLSGTSGKIAPTADLASGDYTAFLGTALSATVLKLKIHAPDVAI
jgi:hypothetical protein